MRPIQIHSPIAPKIPTSNLQGIIKRLISKENSQFEQIINYVLSNFLPFVEKTKAVKLLEFLQKSIF